MAQWCRKGENGILVRVKVVTRSSRPGIQGIEGDHLKVRLKSPPVEGKANRELTEVLARTLKIPRSKVEIVKGHKSKTKELLLREVEPKDLEDLL